MKFTLLALVATAATAAAFTVGPQHVVAITRPSNSAGYSSMTSSSLKMSAALEAQTKFAKSEIESNDVVVFSKSYCPFCLKTKELFESLDVEFTVHELDEMGDDGPALQHALLQMSGQKSVPNVFIKGEHLGGNDDTQAAAKEGKLQEMLGL
mmetsp:Transcript_23316/g.57385  ORF Transcript_23316/g.57385 Transcript_23316/m.57385 type:complete len:152 (+) Transcript_23316:76-531(+)|eukprot:CAMPEP_0113631188 /NCGR_PEP_ID=MMETSP0017_2-20120614/16207_1 /TAXON_ID=2856 /ORGANISM="Cylindrotheca closterium" /LENGTH=151 /DNA_ID=CAMNT_0000541687 /DNA_START=71 /DNA_END=526 /DNA_ORIENTATION=+ /assembly_acc=CAM_ASM_000147